MDQIKELGNIVQKENKGFYDELMRNDSKKGMLFRVIMDDLVKADRDASLLIYGKVDDGKKYQMLKRNLKEKLIEALNSTSEKAHLDLAQIEPGCKEKLILAANLLTNNVFHNAEKLINNVIRKAEKYFLYDVLKDAAILYRNVCSIKGFPDQVIEWNQKIEEYQEISSLNNRAVGVVQVFESYLIHRCGLLDNYALQAEETINSLLVYESVKKSPKLELNLLQLMFYSAYHSNDFQRLYKVNVKIEKLLSEYSFLNSGVLSFHVKLAYAKYYMVVGKLQEAQSVVDNCIKASDYKSFLRFEAQAVNFSLKMKAGDYLKCGEILKEVFSKYEFRLFYSEAKAAWYLRKAYLYFLLQYTSDEESIQKYTPEFTNSSFALILDQNCKKLSKDKMGYNIQYLVIRLLLTWQNTKEETYYSGKNLQLYYYRNLKQLKEERTKNFLKNLSVIAIEHFSKEVVENRSQQFMTAIDRQDYVYRFDINELIPYDVLFKILNGDYP